jgi:hypothetical protein
MDTSDFGQIAAAMGLFLIFFGVHLAAYRRYVVSMFDPLVLFMLSSSFACALLTLTVDDTVQRLAFFGTHIFFFLGFWRGSRQLTAAPAHIPPEAEGSAPLRELKIIVILAFVLWLAVNVYTASQKGFALLAEDPSVAKGDNFAGGLGFVRRINWGLGTFVLCGTLFLYAASKRKKLYLLLLAVQIGFLAMSGAKGALLGVIFGVAYLTAVPALRGNHALAKISSKQPYLFLAAFAVATVVLLRENQDLESASMKFLTRLLFFGDSVLFYYQPAVHAHFARWNVLDYLYTEANPILGFFGMLEYQQPIGYQMVDLTLPAAQSLVSTLGPNTPFYIKADLFFGPVFGLAYASGVGWIIARVRARFFVAGCERPFRFVLLFSTVMLMFTLATESGLFVSRMFDMLFWLTPVLLMARFLMRQPLVGRA